MVIFIHNNYKVVGNNKMKLSIEKNDFLNALNHVQSVVERRNTIPILSNILLDARNGKLSMTATDMDIAIVDSSPSEIITEGAITTPAGTLFDVVRKMPEGAQISLDLDGSKLTISAGRSKFNLPTLPTEEFPVMTGGDMPHTFKIGAPELASLIENTRFAISTEETRYYLNGIYFHAKDGIFRAVATDGHRLAKADTPAPEGTSDMPGVIVPRKTIAELHKLLEQTDNECEISLSDSKIKFAINGAILTSKLVDGTFPDYARVIPQGNPEKFSVDCKSFASAVDRVATIADGKMRAIKMNVENGLLRLTATHADMGNGSDEMEVGYSSTPLEIGFNARYLLDITSQIKSGEAVFEVKDGASPSIIKNSDDDSVLYVLMPMRV